MQKPAFFIRVECTQWIHLRIEKTGVKEIPHIHGKNDMIVSNIEICPGQAFLIPEDGSKVIRFEE